MKKILSVIFCLIFLMGCASEDISTSKEPQASASVPVRVALIDTGLSSEAIPKKNIGDGHNYVNPQNSTEDTFGHGTAVASVIIEKAPDTVIVPLISTEYERGYLTSVENDVLSKMIRDAVDVYNCKIINISSGIRVDVKEIRDAVAYAEEKGVLIIAAAGNTYKELPDAIYYPAAYDSVISVGALNAEKNDLAFFTHRGQWVDGYAPGTDIEVLTLSRLKKTDYGTSLAAAFVCAEAVLILEEKGNIPLSDLKNQLFSKAIALSEDIRAWK